MDELLRAALLALVQGLTEFLPISSSAHLILPAQLLGWPDQGVAFDVAVHLGSLAAVLAYFYRDCLALVSGSFRALRSGALNADARMALYLLIGTLPVVMAGLLLKDLISDQLRSVPVIASTTILFGILLWLADRRRGESALGFAAAFWIGCAQVLALLPGTSRSGITMTAGLFLGLNREQAVRFSFLLSIPVILAASGLTVLDALASPAGLAPGPLLLGMAVSGVTAYLTIHWFIAWVNRIGFLPFVVYRCMLGTLLWIIWFAA
ncbi:MAG: undecaprenyl-diphosphate phosphatase [Halieaceae bacterium]|nr:undecaprenyl-diphosphate phosphatase [Halieaceae bacterium]